MTSLLDLRLEKATGLYCLTLAILGLLGLGCAVLNV
jgi:hypothetical protein